MNVQEIVSIAVAVLGFATAWLQSRRAGQAGLLAEVTAAIALVEKYLSGAPAQQMEDEAVRLVREHLPAVPESIIRALVREACRRRKLRAVGEGLR